LIIPFYEKRPLNAGRLSVFLSSDGSDTCTERTPAPDAGAGECGVAKAEAVAAIAGFLSVPQGSPTWGATHTAQSWLAEPFAKTTNTS